MLYEDNKLFVFGGQSYTGSVRGDVYCCEMSWDKIEEAKSKYKRVCEGIN